jgi:hypothetical protein
MKLGQKHSAASIEKMSVSKTKAFCLRGHSLIKGKNCLDCARERDIKNGRPNRRKNWRRYGILNADGENFTVQDYNRAFQIQGGMCKGCGTHQSELPKALFTDHDHATGIFRGLLCSRCNHILGLAKDVAQTLKNLVNYLG